jgi:hypothetical protein
MFGRPVPVPVRGRVWLAIILCDTLAVRTDASLGRNMSRRTDLGPVSAAGIAGLVVANSSLLIAVLVYMGWAYTNAMWGYFHLNPLDLGVGVVEYMLRGLDLFSSSLVIFAVAFIAVTAARAWDLNLSRFQARTDKVIDRILGGHPKLASSGMVRRMRTGRGAMIAVGMAVTAIGLALALLAQYFIIPTYLVLSLLGAGPLILTWPTRTHHNGRSLYALAISVAAVSVLWAGSLYANSLGIRAAQQLVSGLPGHTAVAVYSTQRLALSGPGVTIQDLGTTFQYRYEYQGLRLLMIRSGTYYLLAAEWTPQYELTYILSDSDQIRIELYSPEEITG